MTRPLIAGILLIILLAACTVTAAPIDQQQAFNHFLAWYKTYKGSPMPPEVARAYSAALAADGLSPEEVKERLAEVQRMAAASPGEMLTVHFNNVFAHHPELFRNEPNQFLVRMARNWKPGKALDAGMGQGRNSVYLAQQGWEVTGYDISDEGLANARKNAEKAGVKVNAIKSTHQTFDFGKEQWDLIVMTYSFVNMQDATFQQKIRESLRPGGIVLVEQGNSGGTGKGPRNALVQTFQDLRVVYYEDAVDTAEWGLMKQRIGRIVAQKE
jgi:2-polyprenyl-3-methyl-5-hydroxy-6-metoxy-1,4-benzoquinol methylase